MKRPVDPEDAQLFRQTVGEVTPLKHDRHVPKRRRAPPRARFAQADRAAVLREGACLDSHPAPTGPADELTFRRPGVKDAVLRKLRRGQYRVQGELDLHGLTVADAQEALRAFLTEAVLNGWQCIRVVHGKGLGSGHRGPVVKQAANSLLRSLGVVSAFVSARQGDGGTGALYVLLRSTTT